MFRLRGKACLINLLGGLILAFGIYNIHSISGVTEGGVLGAMLLLEHWLHISPAISGIILNGICYFFGWKTLGRDFIAYSAISAGSFSLFYAIFEKFPRIYPQIAEHPLIAALLGAVFIGIGAGLAVRYGGAPSGDDALAMSLSQKLNLDIKWIYLASDLLILSLSLSYIPLETIAYSLITVVLSGYIISLILRIGKSKEAEETVLIGTLRNVAQLDTCLRFNFYHIPTARLTTKPSEIKYIAIYQSRSLFGDESGIRYFGKVRNCRLTPRNKIPEIPSESAKLYYRFEIEEWNRLENTILPCDGISPRATTTPFLLRNSRDTFELSLLSEEEFHIYRKIREGLDGNAQIFSCNGFEITSDRNEISISRKGKNAFICSSDDFKTNPKMIFNYIRNEINRSH